MRAMTKLGTTLLGLAAGALIAGCAIDESQATQDEQNELNPNKHVSAVKGQSKPTGGGTSNNGIYYHGGPVMTGTPTIHYIFYGKWSSTQQSLLDSFAGGIGGTPYEHINSTYYNGSNVHVSGAIAHGSNNDTTDNYSKGTSLSDADILTIASKGATDTNAIYMVLTSPDVTATSGFCTQYCGWHDHATVGGIDIKYAFVGNPERCPSSCAELSSGTPNGDVGVDGMVSIIAHESEEAISDPDLNAWYDRRGQENADKCAWTFGVDTTTTNHNVTFGGHNWLIQRTWVNAGGGYCALSD
jgi:hypothetical protein